MKELSSLAQWVETQRQRPQMAEGLSELGWIASLATDCTSSEQAAASIMSRIALILGWGEPRHDKYALTWELWLDHDLNALAHLTDLPMPEDATRIEHVKQAMSDWWDELGLEVERSQAYTAEIDQLRYVILRLQLWFTERDSDTALRLQVFETFLRKQLHSLMTSEKQTAGTLGRQDVTERSIAALERIQQCQVWLPRVSANQQDDLFFPEWETPTHRYVARVEPSFQGRKLVLSITSITSYRRLKAGGFAARETVTHRPRWTHEHTMDTYKAEYDQWIAETIGSAVYQAVLTACRDSIAFA